MRTSVRFTLAAAIVSGLPLNVPTCSSSPLRIIRIASSVPPIAPHGSPAPSAFARHRRSGTTSNASTAPPQATVKPVFTSSKASSASFAWQMSFSLARYRGSGSTTPQFVITGSTIMPAMRPSCSWNARSAASASLNGTTTTCSATPSGMPRVCGTGTGWSRGPAFSFGGNTLTINES